VATVGGSTTAACSAARFARAAFATRAFSCSASWRASNAFFCRALMAVAARCFAT
jgi:hypothetical protein